MEGHKAFRFLLFHLATFTIFTAGVVSGLSIEENLELEKEIALLNKHAQKTIKTKHGDVYDCVDIYDQPALDHPLLKNHKIQMRPTLAKPPTVESDEIERGFTKMGLEEKCPSGTVPIRRTTKEELLAAKSSFTHFFQPSRNHYGFATAGVSTIRKDNTTYQGISGLINIYNPVNMVAGQYSASEITLLSTSGGNLSGIKVGWMANVDLFHDQQTRLFTVWAEGENGKLHGCVNTYCPGFVQVSKYIVPGMVLSPVSVIGGPQYYIQLMLDRDNKTGNWWLINGKSSEHIGYFPKKLFKNLKIGADTVKWEGAAFSTTLQMPQMGNGDNGDIRSAHFLQLAVRYQTWSSLNGSQSVPIELMNNKCYHSGGNSFKGGFWGYSFYYGGNGGDVTQCSDI